MSYRIPATYSLIGHSTFLYRRTLPPVHNYKYTAHIKEYAIIDPYHLLLPPFKLAYLGT